MTIKGLKQFLKKKCLPGVVRNLSSYSGKCVTIDSSIPLYKYVYMSHQWGPNSHLDGFTKHIHKLRENGITPIYVFDGKAPESKHRVINERKEQQKKTTQKLEKLQDILKIKEAYKPVITQAVLLNENDEEPVMRLGHSPAHVRRAYSTYIQASEDSSISNCELNEKLQEWELDSKTFHEITLNSLKEDLMKTQRLCVKPNRTHVEEIQTLMDSMNVKYIQASGEADPICAQLCKNGVAHACITEDMDILTYGASNILTGFSHGNNSVTEYCLSDILNTLEFDMNQFVDFCILCGCDHYGKIKNIGPVSALKLINKHNNIERILDDINQQPYNYKRVNVPVDFTIHGVNCARNEFLQDVVTLYKDEEDDQE